MSLKKLFLFLVLLHLVNAKSATKDWWHNSVIYQIYPRSFQDTDGSGTGDLKGIISRLDYINTLDVDAIWLSPILKSPMKDFGYDVLDFMDIDPVFGTLADFKELLDKAHKRGIKVIMDFIPNHTSDEHEWFLKSVARQEPYTSYYVWKDPRGYDGSGKPLPPNNWVSVFRFSAWEFNEERNQFYLHQFIAGQPDLNYANPAILEEMNKILTFWIKLGVDGFRMDAVANLWEDQRFWNEPMLDDNLDPDCWYSYDHKYTYDQPRTIEILKKMYDTVKKVGGGDVVTFVEAAVKKPSKYYKCSDFPFNFSFISFDQLPITATEMKTKIDAWMDDLPEGKSANWLLGNHDTHRIASRFGPEYIDIMNMIVLSLPGVTITYQGEEIGMRDNLNIMYQATIDPAGLNAGPGRYLICSRDLERTPMQWSGNQKHAGFSNAEKCWLPVNLDYISVNVEDQSKQSHSSLTVYKTLSSLKPIEETSVRLMTFVKNDNVLAFKRTVEDNNGKESNYVTVVNFSEGQVLVDLYHDFPCNRGIGVILARSTGMRSDRTGILHLRAIELGPLSGVTFLLLQI